MIKIELDAASTKRYLDSIDELFEDLQKNVANPHNYDKVMDTMRTGLVQNVFGYENNSEYKKVKKVLKSQGKIDDDKALQVTGQLIADLHWKTISTSPDEIMASIEFKDEFRSRPTIDSMFKVAKGVDDKLKYNTTRSSDVANALQKGQSFIPSSSIHKRAKYPIMENLFSMYKYDVIRRVNQLVGLAFQKQVRYRNNRA